jgi:hypothetical protein
VTEYRVSARRIDNHGSLTVAKEAKVVLDTDMAMRRDGQTVEQRAGERSEPKVSLHSSNSRLLAIRVASRS